MLVLTRKKDESIILGNNIEIKILEIDGEQVKIGINAPKNVEIHRKEVYLMIQEENKQAAMQVVSKDDLTTFFSKSKK